MSTRVSEDLDERTDPGNHVGAHGLPLFAVFDDSYAEEEAVEALRFEGFADSRDIEVFSGEEGLKRLDLTGRSHGLWAQKDPRMLQYATSSDFDYLRTVDEALRHGQDVVVVRVRDEIVADETARLLRMYAGHSIAYYSNWGFKPLAA